jgi:pimeloyl-ACP methyl ester carboxylesterase
MEATATPPATISEHTEQIAGTKTSWRSAPSPEGQSPVLYVHGVPHSSEMWDEFLQRSGGVAIDLPGFGNSDKPQSFEYSIGGYNAFLQAFVGQLEWDRFSVVVHDWGGLALVTAQELHDRIDRIVIINAVPLLPGYRWHRLARGWRTPVFGEFLMGLTTKTLTRHLSKEGIPSGKPWPKEMLDSVWSHFDHGTQRAILRLYRSAPPQVLEQAGERLGLIQAPALVLWGEQDPYIPAQFAQAYADALPNGELKMLHDAGHWPWLDRPETIDQATDFLLNRKTES